MMPKKWLIAAEQDLNEAPSKAEQQKIANEAAKELRELADHHGLDHDAVIKAYGRKVG